MITNKMAAFLEEFAALLDKYDVSLGIDQTIELNGDEDNTIEIQMSGPKSCYLAVGRCVGSGDLRYLRDKESA